ncbi:DUF2877 domain-containing protein [Acidobacteria bacterium ACD]|nr:DUF2877 domain-containing protein [Acidobacteria bacterium ACD]
MRAAAMLADLADAPPTRAKPRKPVPCRALEIPPGRVAVEALVRDLAALPIPARSVALLTGNATGFGEVEGLVLKWTHARSRSLVATLLRGDVRVVAYRPDVSALTGLGPGLTPTGDDVLVGLAAMSKRLASAGILEARAATAYATSLAGLVAAETTPAARELLVAASKGQYPTALAAVVEAMGSERPDRPALKEQAGRLVAMGAHSGADLLAGALALVRGVIEPREKG